MGSTGTSRVIVARRLRVAALTGRSLLLQCFMQFTGFEERPSCSGADVCSATSLSRPSVRLLLISALIASIPLR
jgi:hypothetical protein